MRTAFFDCFSGASGDMILGALVDAGASVGKIASELKKLPLRGFSVSARRVMKGPIGATKFTVRVTGHGHSHHHTRAADILKMIRKSRLENGVKENAVAIFTRLARAEGKVHRISPARVEFHEVGAVDSIVDIVGACIALSLLGIRRLRCSRFPVTHGSVRTQHGDFPIPGPATLELLKGWPVTSLDIDRELVTPTGAAILTTLAEKSPQAPEMILEKTGYGAGDFDLGDRPNVLRVLVGESAVSERSDLIWVLETNLDNVSGETVGYVMDRLMNEGALDVYATPITMKKSRPAVKLSVLVSESARKKIEHRMFEELPTLGIRRMQMERSKLERRQETVRTPYGKVSVKVASLNGGVLHVSPEYDDCRRLALRSRVPLETVSRSAEERYRNKI